MMAGLHRCRTINVHRKGKVSNNSEKQRGWTAAFQWPTAMKRGAGIHLSPLIPLSTLYIIFLLLLPSMNLIRGNCWGPIHFFLRGRPNGPSRCSLRVCEQMHQLLSLGHPSGSPRASQIAPWLGSEDYMQNKCDDNAIWKPGNILYYSNRHLKPWLFASVWSITILKC